MAELLAVCQVSLQLIGVPERDFWTVVVMLELQQLNFHSPVLNLRFKIYGIYQEQMFFYSIFKHLLAF